VDAGSKPQQDLNEIHHEATSSEQDDGNLPF